MTVYADAFGNVCGNCVIPFNNNSFNCPIADKERDIIGELRLCLYGMANDIKAEAHMNVFDITHFKNNRTINN